MASMSSWHEMEVAEVLQQLNTEATRGLSTEEASRRLAAHGPNELPEQGAKSPWAILWEQLTSVMVVILIVAGVISVVMGDYKDAVVIMAVVLLNSLLGFSQEYRAERAMAALKELAVPTVRVRRDGRAAETPARELVPGDIVLLQAGNLMPADCRLLEGITLRVHEAALTGESEPVEKHPRALKRVDLPLGDRRNLVYMGTVVTYGRGVGVVTETGTATQLGGIAQMLQATQREPTPLQRRLGQLGRGLALAAVVIVTLVFVLGLLRGENLRLMFMTAISMAVAAVPEGLPAVVTIALALGTQRMLKRRALIRKLPAVETLGSVSVICSDKTGTLTENRMTVTVLDVAGHRLDLTEHLRRSGSVVGAAEQQAAGQSGSPALGVLLAGGALCSDATVQHDGEQSGSFHSVGDPTEGAWVVAAARMGLWKPDLEQTYPRVAEIPFDSERKRMTTAHRSRTVSDVVADWELVLAGSPYVAFTKGAVDGLIQISGSVLVEGHVEPLTDKWRERIAAANDRLARDGMRVLGLGYRPVGSAESDDPTTTLERDLIFAGMVGMIDPPRLEVKDAVQTCKDAGIRPVMITGDHPLTALAIARELGIASDGLALSGADLDGMSPEQLEEEVLRTGVYARVSPEHKFKIVEALQRQGHIVAMTGDGVNDAPALKKADIGVAMGISGTDVSREAADMVLLDDNFSTIVAAVEEGRVIYDNLRKFIRYAVTTNSAEILVMLLAPVVGMPLPLLPLQILWINLVTDGLPGLALGMEPAEPGTMRRPPHPPTESIFGRGMRGHIIWVGLLMALVSLGTGYWCWQRGDAHWQTMVFTVLTLSQLANVMAIRSERESLFRLGLLSNRHLLAAVALTFALQMAVTYIPFPRQTFRIEPLGVVDLGACLALASTVFWAVEVEKWVLRRTRRKLSAVHL